MKQYIDEEIKAFHTRLKRKGIIDKNVDFDNKAIEIMRELKPFFQKQDTLEKKIDKNRGVYKKIMLEKQELCSKINVLIKDDIFMKRRILSFLFEEFEYLKYIDGKHKRYYLDYKCYISHLSQADTEKKRKEKIIQIFEAQGKFYTILKLKKKISKILGLSEFPSTISEEEWRKLEDFQFYTRKEEKKENNSLNKKIKKSVDNIKEVSS